MKTSESIKEIATALSKVQGEIKGAKADSQNPFFKSSYADLASVWDAIREPLKKNGLSVTQMTDLKDGQWCVVTRIMHISGEWIEGYFPIVVSKQNDPQSLGSATSYARRYALAAAMGVYQIDDDAEQAVQRTPMKQGHCTHSWVKSKFNKNEEFCSKCKEKRTVAPLNTPEKEDNIPF